MKKALSLRCAIYTRKSTSEGLEQDFNSLDAQRSACEAYIQSQTHEGWQLLETHYDDGGYSGASMERPALQSLITAIESGLIDVVVVYKVDRLTRSLADFARLVDLFDQKHVSFVSVTQAFNTTNSMGRLTPNVLLSFAQFEREVTAERIRDKIRDSKAKGIWMGGRVPLGYDARNRQLIINKKEAETVRTIFERYLELRSVPKLQEDLKHNHIVSKRRTTKEGKKTGGFPFTKGALYALLQNPIYIGKIRHGSKIHEGNHKPIISTEIWEEVQAQLKTNRIKRKTSALAKDPSLLAGLLFDEQNQPLHPRHTNKQGKRYRYYVNQNHSIPAIEIESVTQQQLIDYLGSKDGLERILGQHSNPNLDVVNRKREHLVEKLQTNPTRDCLLDLIDKITLNANQIDIHVRMTKIVERIYGSESSQVNIGASDVHTLTCKGHIKRSGNGKRFILKSRSPSPKADPALIKTIARAHLWFDELKQGKSFKEISKENHIDQRHVARTIRLAFLAPNITQSILQGNEPESMTPIKLQRLPEIPISWDEQQSVIAAL